MRRWPAVLAALAALAATGCLGELTPEGDKHRYVIASVDLPDAPGEASLFSLDLDGSNRRPNQFGAALAGLQLDTIATAAIKAGGASILLELQTRDFFEAAASGVAMRSGIVLAPAPCRGPNDCGYHLTGGGSFDLAPDSPDEPALFGSVRGGTLLTDFGNELTVLFSFDGERAIQVPLLAARVQLTQMTEARIGRGTIAGGIPQLFLAGRFVDELQSGSIGPLLESCNFNGAACTCLPGTAGALLQAAFDLDGNCNISRGELVSSPAITQMLAADLDVMGVPMVSFGMGFVANSASF